ncbi:MAG: DMT family transporter [Bacteroidales bacterium]|nr:DMT family transporter [Bacteroidales bacterium]
MKLKGYLLAAIAAASYGTNPAFAIPLYADGMNSTSVLLLRYLLSLPILLVMILWRGQNLKLKRTDLFPVAVLGILMAISSLGLFEAYKYMNAGVASTLLFMYPVMVAVLMSFFFHERFRITTGICLAVMGAGLLMLMRTDGDNPFSMTGFLFVFISSLTYALYLVMTNVSKKIKEIPTVKLLFYQLLIGSSLFFAMLAAGEPFIMPTGWQGWANVSALAIFPTALSLSCTTLAIHYIGSTPTAIFGALEPVTAVALSVLFLGQPLAPREIGGGVLILLATTMVIAADPIDHTLLRMRKMFPSLRRHRQ